MSQKPGDTRSIYLIDGLRLIIIRSADFELEIEPPNKSGTYYLEFDMVHENVTWFHQKGSPAAIIEIEVK